MENDPNFSRIEERLGHSFRDRDLLAAALTHRSYAHEQAQAASRSNSQAPVSAHYERLEFLGDTVLALVISDLIMRQYPTAAEGELSRLRSGLVNCERLAELARGLGLGEALRLGRGEESTAGRDKASILAAAYEALLAAVYLDAGFQTAYQVIANHFRPLLEHAPAEELLADYKSPLQEKIQARLKTTPVYRVVKEEGPDHMKVFEVELLVNGKVVSRGRGRSKKEAEQAAAKNALLSGKFEE